MQIINNEVVKVENASEENMLDKTITAEEEDAFQCKNWFKKLSDSGWFENYHRHSETI